MVLFALPIVGFMLIFPERLMWLFGEQFKSGANLLRIFALGQFVNVMTGCVGYLLSMSGHERVLRNVFFISGPMASQNLLAVGMVERRLGGSLLDVGCKSLEAFKLNT